MPCRPRSAQVGSLAAEVADSRGELVAPPLGVPFGSIRMLTRLPAITTRSPADSQGASSGKDRTSAKYAGLNGATATVRLPACRPGRSRPLRGSRTPAPRPASTPAAEPAAAGRWRVVHRRRRSPTRASSPRLPRTHLGAVERHLPAHDSRRPGHPAATPRAGAVWRPVPGRGTRCIPSGGRSAARAAGSPR